MLRLLVGGRVLRGGGGGGRELKRAIGGVTGLRMASSGGGDTGGIDPEVQRLAGLDITEGMSADEKKAVRDARKAMKELEKAKKKEKKAAAAAAAAAAANVVVEPVAYLDAANEPTQLYGDYKMIQSACKQTGSGRIFTRVEELDEKLVGKEVWLRARLHNLRPVAKNAFLVLRQRSSTAQAVLSPNEQVTKDMIKWVLKNISTESVVDVKGEIVASDVKSCTQNKVEIAVQRVYVVSRAAQPLPFLPDDAARPADVEGVHVDRKTRLDSRIVDLRVQAHQAIFRTQSGTIASTAQTPVASVPNSHSTDNHPMAQDKSVPDTKRSSSCPACIRF